MVEACTKPKSYISLPNAMCGCNHHWSHLCACLALKTHLLQCCCLHPRLWWHNLYSCLAPSKEVYGWQWLQTDLLAVECGR